MTTMKKAPETESPMPDHMTALRGRPYGISDVLAAQVAKSVDFGKSDIEGVQHALLLSMC